MLSNRTECLDPGEGETPDDVRYSYSACNTSGSALETRYACSSRGNSWMHTYKECSGAGVLSNRKECLDPGDDETDDDVRYSYSACNTSGSALETRYACSDRDDDYLHSYTTCSNGATGSATECLSVGDTETTDAQVGTRSYCDGSSEDTESVCGPNVDDREATVRECSGDTVTTRTVAGQCGHTDTTGATETYCDSNAAEDTRDIAGCTDTDTTPISCSSGQVMNSDGCCETCTTANATGPSSCPPGQELKLNTVLCLRWCRIVCPSTPNTPMPASTSPGQWWEWDDDEDNCGWVSITIPEPAWVDECGSCGQVIGDPPRWCREYTSCGWRWNATLGWWVEFYSGSSTDQPFN